MLLGLLPSLAHAGLPSEGHLHDQWMKMNYYYSNGNRYETEIQNSNFFLSHEGESSPQSEFDAFSQAMRNSDEDAICRFPARTTLLISEVPEFKNFKRPDCSRYPRYIDTAKVTGISLIFASGYFESPSSYFGHTMMKFETDRRDFSEYFFDSSLNYGAEVTNAPGLLYIAKGLTGGYKASYKRNNDFINTYNYTSKDMRDVWEYPLKLTQEQRNFIVEYSSELRQAEFKYYFFSDNCAHRMARLIEQAMGRPLVNTTGLWLLPIEVVQAMNSPEVGGSPFGDEIRTPSLKSQVRQRYLKLPTDEQSDVKRYLTSSLKQQKAIVGSLDDESLAIIRMHYDVELAKLSTKPKDAQKLQALQPHRQVILVETLKRSPSEAPESSVKGFGVTPATMNHPSAVQLGYIARSGEGALNLRYQVSNNDLLNKPFEGQEASRFIFGAGEIEASKSKLRLSSLTFLDVLSLNTNPLPMKATGEYSWSIKAGYGPRNLICDKCSTMSVDAKIGKAIRLSEDFLLYGLIGGQVNHKQTDYNDVLMLTSENGVLLDLNDSTRLNVEANIEVSPVDGNPSYLFKGAAVRDLSDQTDLRLSMENDGDHSAAMLRIGFYLN